MPIFLPSRSFGTRMPACGRTTTPCAPETSPIWAMTRIGKLLAASEIAFGAPAEAITMLPAAIPGGISEPAVKYFTWTSSPWSRKNPFFSAMTSWLASWASRAVCTSRLFRSGACACASPTTASSPTRAPSHRARSRSCLGSVMVPPSRVSEELLELGLQGDEVARDVRAGPWQRHVQHRVDAPRPRRHHHHAIGEQQRFLDRVGHEEHGLAGGRPDLGELVLHESAGLGVQRAERLAHHEKPPDVRGRPRGCHALLPPPPHPPSGSPAEPRW